MKSVSIFIFKSIYMDQGRNAKSTCQKRFFSETGPPKKLIEGKSKGSQRPHLATTSVWPKEIKLKYKMDPS
jgi:hypothetical protein